MLAIPLDTKETTTISKLYGRAPYFALLDMDTGNFQVIKNEVVGKGPKSADFLKELGATSTIFYHMGEGVYKSFEKNGMSVYTIDYAQESIDWIYRRIKKRKFTKLNESNYKKLLDAGEGATCNCGCEKN